jgi:hypothetical protein
LRAKLHPVLQYVEQLLCGICAVALAIVSWMANPHSVTWLVALYVTTLLFLAGMRRQNKSALVHAYIVYLAFLANYLLVVWYLHVEVPGANLQQTQSQLLFWIRAMVFFSNGQPIACYRSR